MIRENAGARKEAIAGKQNRPIKEIKGGHLSPCHVMGHGHDMQHHFM